MATQVLLPQLGESVFEGTIIKWHKKEGERIEKDETLFDISTDKIDTEVPSSEAGVVSKILVAEGETVEVNTPVAEIDGAAKAEKTEVKEEEPIPSEKILDRTEWSEPVSHIRKMIADKMYQSENTAVHVTNVIEVDMSKIVEIHNKLKDEFKKKHGYSLTYLAFLAKSTIESLLEHPILNSALKDDSIIYRKYVNLGIAVATDEGLIVPVIKNSEKKDVIELAHDINDLASKAREKKLLPDEVQQGTFTITNQGIFGSIVSSPIINWPQVAILSFEAITKRPVVEDDEIKIKPMVNLPLSWDHRVMDGAVALKFLATLKEKLESFSGNKI